MKGQQLERLARKKAQTNLQVLNRFFLPLKTYIENNMKKLILTALAAVMAASAGTVSAQEFQSIGNTHSVSFGAGYGRGSGNLANYVFGFGDYNFAPAALPGSSYFRARLELSADQITSNFSVSTTAGFQYMQNIFAGLYVYPFVRVKGEFHRTWANKADFAPGAGAGIEYQFTHFLGVFAQGTYEYLCCAGTGRPTFQAGLVFAIGAGRSNTNSIEAKKKKLAGIVEYNASQARAARQAAKAAAQREVAEQVAAEKMRQEAAKQAASQMFDDEATQNAYVEYQTGKPSAVSVPFVKGECNVGKTSRTKILGLVPYLLSNPGATVEILAYGDKFAENADAGIAAKREKAVRDILTSAGIAAERIVDGKPSAAQSVTSQPGSVAIVKIK